MTIDEYTITVYEVRCDKCGELSRENNPDPYGAVAVAEELGWHHMSESKAGIINDVFFCPRCFKKWEDEQERKCLERLAAQGLEDSLE